MQQQNQNNAGGQRQAQGGNGNPNATSDQPAGPVGSGSAPMSPGDEAPAGTPGTGENVCPCCGGSGKMGDGKDCEECSGTGKVTVGIGGA